jgi:hypothetical protein
MAGTWHDSVRAESQEELARRVIAALEIGYTRDSSAFVYLDHVLNGRWFAVPKRFGGEKV